MHGSRLPENALEFVVVQYHGTNRCQSLIVWVIIWLDSIPMWLSLWRRLRYRLRCILMQLRFYAMHCQSDMWATVIQQRTLALIAPVKGRGCIARDVNYHASFSKKALCLNNSTEAPQHLFSQKRQSDCCRAHEAAGAKITAHVKQMHQAQLNLFIYAGGL